MFFRGILVAGCFEPQNARDSVQHGPMIALRPILCVWGERTAQRVQLYTSALSVGRTMLERLTPARCGDHVALPASPGSSPDGVDAVGDRYHDPKPFIWTKPVDHILIKLNRLNASVH
jgi:hypothetical protein